MHLVESGLINTVMICERIQGGEATEDEPPIWGAAFGSFHRADRSTKRKTDQASVPELNIRLSGSGMARSAVPSPYPPGHGRDTDQWKTAVSEFLTLGDKELGDQHKCPNTQA